jgi:phenylalanyl-tRNA synthetase beta chain
MKISPSWVREFVELTVDDRRLAEDLTSVGIAVEGISGAGAETIFEMEIGTNRPDAMNHYGVAREAAAIYDLPLRRLSAGSSQLSARPERTSAAEAAPYSVSNGTTEVVPFPKVAPSSVSNGTTEVLPLPKAAPSVSRYEVAFPISVEERDLCPRFSARVIRGVTIKSSPEKVVRRLGLLDQRAINNAVDATNYVLWEMGKPTHVFDLDLLEGGRIVVRRAKKGERLKTLDGIERKLTPDDLVVADGKKPVALAGVMGGFDTMITAKTRNVLIESAWWDPAAVRKTARRHGIHTDASHRFERGADYESTVLSCERVAELILQSGGGELVGGVIDVVAKQMDQAPVELHVSEVHRILGGSLGAREIFGILKKLGFEAVPAGQGETEFTVHIPSWRLDVEREIDVIEEIARIHGYDKFENTLPATSGAVIELPDAAKDATVRSRALALGYNEAVSLTFISHADAERFSSAAVLELENPLSEEAGVMRTSLAPGMLDMLAWNLNRGAEEVRLFEMGGVFEAAGETRIEPKRACLGATVAAVKLGLAPGGVLDVSKGEHATAAEAFRSFKGDVENLLTAFECGAISYEAQAADYYHAGRSARALVDDAMVAQFGQVSGAVAAVRKLRGDVFLAEIYLDALYQLGLRKVKYRALAKYPAAERDFSFVFPDAVSFAEMERVVSGLGVGELKNFRPVEIFRGGTIGAGKYSILLRAIFQSEAGTLREDQIAAWAAKLVRALQRAGGVQRG